MRDLRFHSRDGRFGLALDAGQVMRLVGWCVEAGRQETGGILIGRYSVRHDCALVTDVLGPTVDSQRGPTWFDRGVAGLHSVLDRVWGQKRNHYLGEWHFHPFAAPNPSATDRAQMAAIASSTTWKCPEPVLLIIGGDPRAIWTTVALVTTRRGERIELQALTDEEVR